MRKTIQLTLQLCGIAAMTWYVVSDKPWFIAAVGLFSYIVGTIIGTTVTYTQDETENEETN